MGEIFTPRRRRGAISAQFPAGRARRSAGRSRNRVLAPEALDRYACNRRLIRQGSVTVKIVLPTVQRRLIRYELANPAPPVQVAGPAPRSRVLYAAAHVVSDPLADFSPAETPCLDWEATLAFRRHLWSCGLSVAEAMDTA